jgi:hypothetical protein
MKKPSSRTAPAHEMRSPDHISKRVRAITQWVGYKKRVPLPNETLPPSNDLWQRPVYNPATDNR